MDPWAHPPRAAPADRALCLLISFSYYQLRLEIFLRVGRASDLRVRSSAELQTQMLGRLPIYQ